MNKTKILKQSCAQSSHT